MSASPSPAVPRLNLPRLSFSRLVFERSTTIPPPFGPVRYRKIFVINHSTDCAVPILWFGCCCHDIEFIYLDQPVTPDLVSIIASTAYPCLHTGYVQCSFISSSHGEITEGDDMNREARAHRRRNLAVGHNREPRGAERRAQNIAAHQEAAANLPDGRAARILAFQNREPLPDAPVVLNDQDIADLPPVAREEPKPEKKFDPDLQRVRLFYTQSSRYPSFQYFMTIVFVSSALYSFGVHVYNFANFTTYDHIATCARLNRGDLTRCGSVLTYEYILKCLSLMAHEVGLALLKNLIWIWMPVVLGLLCKRIVSWLFIENVPFGGGIWANNADVDVGFDYIKLSAPGEFKSVRYTYISHAGLLKLRKEHPQLSYTHAAVGICSSTLVSFDDYFVTNPETMDDTIAYFLQERLAAKRRFSAMGVTSSLPKI